MVSALADDGDLRQEIIRVKENEALPLPAISSFIFICDKFNKIYDAIFGWVG